MIISSKKLPFYYFAQGKIEFWLFTAMLSFKPPKIAFGCGFGDCGACG